MQLRFRAGLVAAAFLFGAGLARAEDEKIPLDKIPAKILDAVKAKHPAAEIVSCVKEIEDGMTEFEIVLKEGGKKWEVKFNADGKYLGREEYVTEAEVPAAVLEAFGKKFPDVKATAYEKETTGEGDAAKIIYEIHYKVGDKKKEAKYDPAGKLVGEE